MPLLCFSHIMCDKYTLEHTAATMVSSSSSDWHGVGSSSLQAVIAILATPDERNP